MGRFKSVNGKLMPVVVILLSALIGVIGWNLRSVAQDVKANSEHRIETTVADKHIETSMEAQKKKICWLENSVRAIHNEQQVDRGLLNRIADKVGAEGAPAVEPLPPVED